MEMAKRRVVLVTTRQFEVLVEDDGVFLIPTEYMITSFPGI